jgi:hypothetical protein
MLAKDTAARWPNVSDAAHALDRELGGALPATVVAPAPAETATRHRVGPWIAASLRGHAGKTRGLAAVLASIVGATALLALAPAFGREPSIGSDAAPPSEPPARVSAGTSRPSRDADVELWAALRTADSLSTAGDFDAASALLARLADGLAALSVRVDDAPSRAHLHDSLAVVSERHRAACDTYAALLIRRGRTAPQCR